MNSHRIKVLGRDFQIRTAASSERVQEIESFLNGRIAEIERGVKGSDPFGVAVLALLNLAEQVLNLSRHGGDAEDSEKIRMLLRLIETAQ